MSAQTLVRRLCLLEAIVEQRRRTLADRTLDVLRADPTKIMTLNGYVPDPWQAGLLRSQAAQIMMLACRQGGKSHVAGALALHTALVRPLSPILLLSPTQRQSAELFRCVRSLLRGIGRPIPIVKESALQLELANGSRIMALPGKEANVRCYSSVSMLIIDEAARVADALYYAVRPMLAVSRGRLVALSTPFGKRGWFHDAWHSEEPWERVRITADQCPRITPQFLEEERRALGERWFRQEFCCEFTSTIDAVFAYEDIQAALSDDVQPLFNRMTPSRNGHLLEPSRNGYH